MVDSETVRDSRRPRELFEVSFRNFDGRLNACCGNGMLMSLELRSLSGRLGFSFCLDIDCLPTLGSGMRLEVPRLLCVSDMGLLFGKDGRDPAGDLAGEPADRGCDIQSSDNESSQAFSIAY